MTGRAAALLAVLATFALAARVADGRDAGHKPAEKHAGLERFKQLAGEWVGKGGGGGDGEHPIVVKYAVTSAGSAVVETIGPGSDHEMVTVIHQDGKDLALTHYCAAGNQPHMKADGKGEGNKFEFKFIGGSNMKSDKDGHMHSVTYTFVDPDTLRSDWTFYQDGKSTGTTTFELKRKK